MSEFYEEYKPYHRSRLYTKTEKEVDDELINLNIDSDPNPFPFYNDESEDDYGDESWA